MRVTLDCIVDTSDHLERSQDIITDLDTDPEINPPKQNRLCGGFGDDDPQYTEQELSTRLAEIDTAILSNALRPGDTTLWDSYLLRALMQWSETTDQVKQYMVSLVHGKNLCLISPRKYMTRAVCLPSPG